jgi:hypothetical protein
MAIIGDEIRNYVAQQINVRQAIHGLGAGQALDNVRPDVVINVLNSNTSWVKLASGVSVASSKLTEIGVDTALDGLKLAKRYVLNAGFSKYEETKLGGRLTQREGFLPQETNSSYTYGTYGYSPMPGITSADIKALNRGSIKKATVKIKINNKEQFDIIDLLYFRLGYTVLLEWGNSLYFDNSVKKDNVRETIIDNESYFFNSTFGGSDSYVSILPKIENYRDKYAGNYDGLLGKISNFQWSFNKDGSYDAEITIISLGDVVESLKTNISTDRGLSNFILQANTGATTQTPTEPPTTSTTETEQPDILEDNKDANAIASMLWVWKWVSKPLLSKSTVSADRKIENILSDGSTPLAGGFLNPSGENIEVTTTKYKAVFKIYDTTFPRGDGSNLIPIEEKFPSALSDPAFSKHLEYQFTKDQLDPTEYMKTTTQVGFKGITIVLDTQFKIMEDLRAAGKDILKRTESRGAAGIDSEISYQVEVDLEPIIGSDKLTATESPIKDFGFKDAFFLNSFPKFPLYLRLGALLNYIQNNILPKIDTSAQHALKPPIFKINYNTLDNIIYSLPNQISLDPRVCIVTNLNFSAASSTGAVKEQLFTGLLAFRTEDSTETDKHPNKAFLMNIYLNFNFIIESLNSAADERGDTNTFTFLQNICDGINKALGGINNIEPIMDEETNTLRLQDTTPIPGNNNSFSYVLQLYGYDKLGKGYVSNFVRKVDLKTAITPEYATMITVGATAGGYVKGTEATAFSRWNEGLTDRFKEKFTPGNEASKPEGGVDEAVTNYVEKMINISKYPATLGFLPSPTGVGFGEESTDAIESNLSVGTEYFKYLIASQKNQQGGTVGFIPFKIGFTMDGLSGIKIYNKLHVDTRFLPKAYGNTLDLIVTGVSHKLAKNDWETDIEATVIPKTNELKDLVITAATLTATIEQGVTAGGGVAGKVTDCSGIPASSGLSNSAKKIVKASDSTSAKAIGYVINYLEGGYFHPLHAWNSDGTFKSTFDYRTKSSPNAGNSGETLWGIDRPNGAHESSKDATIKKAGVAFWAEVDKKSGFGIYKAQNKTVKKYNWKVASYPKPTTYWKWLYNPGFTSGTVLADNAKVIINNGFEKNMTTYFGSHPLYNIVKNDGRLLFLYYRAWWNGPGWFQKFARNLKNKYNAGETNVDKLICLDLTYRYNAYSTDFWKKGISKMKDMIDFNP